MPDEPIIANPEQKFLDNITGLPTLWDKIKLKDSAIPFGQVDSTSTSTAFTATVPGITQLFDGVVVMLKNGVVTSAANFTIEINNLGALPVYSNMAAATRESTIFNINYTLLFVYDSTRVEGGCWINYRGYYSDSNSIGYQVRTNSGTLPASAKFYRYRLLFTSADGSHWVPSNTSTSTNATAKRDVIQTPINPFGPIVYYGTTTAIEAEAVVTAAQLWQQYTLTLGYSFNRTGAALVLQFPKPIYIKCAPQVNGSAIIDATTPYVEELPNSADGKIYIFLGIAYSETNVELRLEHPVYWYDGTGIRLWEGKAPGESITIDDELSSTSTNPVQNKIIYEALTDTATIYSMTSAGSVTNGTKASFTQGSDSFTPNTPTVLDTTKFSGGSFTRGAFSGGSFTQGTDSFTPNTPTAINVSKFNGGSFTQGTDAFTQNTPTVIDTSKFSGGSFTRGAFSGGSFTQGTDSFTPNTPTAINVSKFSGGSFTQGTDSFTQNTPTVIDTSKFSGGSFTRGTFSGGSFTQGTDSFTANTPTVIDTSKFSGGSFTRGTFSGGSFTQGTDSFTANTPTVIDTTKFSGGSYSHTGFSGGSFTRGTFSQGTLPSMSFAVSGTNNNILTISFNQGTLPTHAADSFTPASYGTDSFTPASLASGFYTAGTAASFTQGTDSFTPATHANDTFTAAKLNTGFYTAGTAASFTQGTDSFTPATHAADTFTAAKLNSGFYTAGTKATFTQGTDSFTPASLATGFYTAGTAASFSQGTDSFTPATHAADTFTAAKLNSGFYTAGTKATFTQGTDSFTAASLSSGFYTAGTAASFTQGEDSFTPATHAADTFTAAALNSGFYTAGTAASFTQGTDSFTQNTPTSVTLPSRGSAIDVVKGIS